jgi:Zn-dependent peptidase ImmA (M78 family)/transcriptional regulator with XRE-family HTH domain
MPPQRAIIKPELLVWTREEAGLSVEDAAKKIAISPERLLACERGNSQLTVRQLRTLSNAYKRPLAFFYLPKPPPKTESLRDFRRAPNEVAEPESPALLYEIRRAKYRRRIAIELLRELGEPIAEFQGRATLHDDTFGVARQLRALLGITRARQKHFGDEYTALKGWREAIENAGVVVFQASGIDNREMLGFSLSEPLLPVIVLNMSDAPVRRIFTMMHEMAHLMLRTGGLCTLKEVERIEVFCNEVAGESLVPQAWLLDEPVVKANANRREWPDNIIEALARRYRVSREVVLRRLLVADYTTQAFYEAKREQYQREYEAFAEAAKKRKEQEQKGGASPSTMAVSESGRMFIRLVLEGYRRDKITIGDVSDYLEVRTKHLDNIAKAIENPTLELGAA